MSKSINGFTLLELVVVIVILGILSVTAAPRFLNIQRDAHESLAQAAFSSFRTAINMYHSQWLVDGEPKFSETVSYGVGDVYPSDTGFPIAVDTAPSNGTSIANGEYCAAIWTAIMDSDLTVRPQGVGSVLPSNTDIVSWYTSAPACYYYYTTGFANGESLPHLLYSPITGEITITTETPAP